MNNIIIKNDDARPEMDAILGEFFQAELPRQWPKFKAPMSTRTKEPVSFWSRSSGRLALAACIALLVGGYLSLGGFFPRAQAPNGVHQAAPDTASRPERKKDLPKTQNNRTDDSGLATPMDPLKR